MQYAGVDGAICKAELVAKVCGYIDKEKLGIALRVNDITDNRERGLVNEVKRMGYLVDRESEMQLRIGDTLIVYISKSNA